MTPDATITAKHFTLGRAESVRVLVVHTAETACAPGVARAVASWFAGASAPQASAHFVVGPDEVVACVPEGDTAWHAPPVNAYSIGVEHTARAAFTPDDWASDAAQGMLARSAALFADLCTRYCIPAVFVDELAMASGASGITTHAAVSRAFHKTDHTDPGIHFPLDDFLAQIQAAMAQGSP